MKPNRERQPTQKTKNSRAAWLGEVCKNCGKRRQNHSRIEALRCGE